MYKLEDLKPDKKFEFKIGSKQSVREIYNLKRLKFDVKAYIDYYITKNKEDHEETFEEEFDPTYLIIPYKNTLYELWNLCCPWGSKEEKRIWKYCSDFNTELINQMSKRGYKANWCEEDIEFYK